MGLQDSSQFLKYILPLFSSLVFLFLVWRNCVSHWRDCTIGNCRIVHTPVLLSRKMGDLSLTSCKPFLVYEPRIFFANLHLCGLCPLYRRGK